MRRSKKERRDFTTNPIVMCRGGPWASRFAACFICAEGTLIRSLRMQESDFKYVPSEAELAHYARILNNPGETMPHGVVNACLP